MKAGSTPHNVIVYERMVGKVSDGKTLSRTHPKGVAYCHMTGRMTLSTAGLATLAAKVHVVNVFIFAGCMTSVASTPLSTAYTMLANGHDCDLSWKLIL